MQRQWIASFGALGFFCIFSHWFHGGSMYSCHSNALMDSGGLVLCDVHGAQKTQLELQLVNNSNSNNNQEPTTPTYPEASVTRHSLDPSGTTAHVERIETTSETRARQRRFIPGCWRETGYLRKYVRNVLIKLSRKVASFSLGRLAMCFCRLLKLES